MTDRIALMLALALALLLIADFALMGGTVSLFLARKFVVLVEWAMFWR